LWQSGQWMTSLLRWLRHATCSELGRKREKGPSSIPSAILTPPRTAVAASPNPLVAEVLQSMHVGRAYEAHIARSPVLECAPATLRSRESGREPPTHAYVLTMQACWLVHYQIKGKSRTCIHHAYPSYSFLKVLICNHVYTVGISIGLYFVELCAAPGLLANHVFISAIWWMCYSVQVSGSIAGLPMPKAKTTASMNRTGAKNDLNDLS